MACGLLQVSFESASNTKFGIAELLIAKIIFIGNTQETELPHTSVH
jgi:hypothetical protein